MGLISRMTNTFLHLSSNLTEWVKRRDGNGRPAPVIPYFNNAYWEHVGEFLFSKSYVVNLVQVCLRPLGFLTSIIPFLPSSVFY